MEINLIDLINTSKDIQPILNNIVTIVFSALGGGAIKVVLDYIKDKRTIKLEEDKFDVKNKDDLIEELNAMLASERETFRYELEQERQKCTERLFEVKGIMQGQITILQNQVASLLSKDLKIEKD